MAISSNANPHQTRWYKWAAPCQGPNKKLYLPKAFRLIYLILQAEPVPLEFSGGWNVQPGRFPTPGTPPGFL